MPRKKPKPAKLRVECEYDDAKAIKMTGFMAPVRGHPGRWFLLVDMSHDIMHPPDRKSDG